MGRGGTFCLSPIGWLSVLLLLLLTSNFSATKYIETQNKYLTIIGTVDGNVHAVDQTFKKVWSTSLGERMIHSTVSMKLNKRYTSVIPSLDGSILFQNARGIRRSPIKSKVMADLSPILSRDGLIHVGTKNCRLYCFNLADGSLMVDPSNGDSKSLKSTSLDADSEYSSIIPFWLGRLDYQVNGVDPESGQEEFSVVFSDLEPLRDGKLLDQFVKESSSHELKLNNGKAISMSSSGLISSDSPEEALQTEIISSPEGFIHFIDEDGSILNDEPVNLGSPVMNAFLLTLNTDNVAHLVRRVSVRYGLNNMNTMHKLRSPKPNFQIGSGMENENMVLIQSSSNDAGAEVYYGMELLPTVHLLPSPNTLGGYDDGFGDFGQHQWKANEERSIRLTKFSAKSHLHSSTFHGRNIKSIRQSGSFSDLGINNDSVKQHLSNIKIRKPVSSIIGFHKITDSDEELWYDELFRDKFEKVINTVSVPVLKNDMPWNNTRLDIYSFFAGVLVILITLSLIFIIIPRVSHWINSGFLYNKIARPDTKIDGSESSPSAKDGLKSSRVGSLSVSDEIIGYGSHGTVVFKGLLNGRAVAVKRMLSQFNHLAEREISLLIKSDGHPNVVRYFVKEERNDFVYLGLQLCDCSLKDLISFSAFQPVNIRDVTDNIRFALLQVARGLSYLHSNRIVHRDIKPHNILCSYIDSQAKPFRLQGLTLTDIGNFTLKISDMGLSKQLDGENSFSTLSLPTNKHNGNAVKGVNFEPLGTIGWQAPEMMTRRGNQSDVDIPTDSVESDSSKRTLAVDVFSLGCVFYYVLSLGYHPFGDWYERESNIINNKVSLQHLNNIPDAMDLVHAMISINPSKRPTIMDICDHHFFWDAAKRLDYLTTFSDKIELESPDSGVLIMLQNKSNAIFNMRWDKQIDEVLLEDSGKYRKYDPYSVVDLLRLIRNKKNHYHELSQSAKCLFDSFPTGFCHYFESRFPTLLGICITVASTEVPDGKIDVVSSENQDAIENAEAEAPSVISGIVVWQGSAIYNKYKCRGWWRDASEWTDLPSYSSSTKNIKKCRSIHHTRALSDKKYRTKLCSHWEMSGGESCPMRKKGKCIFAHGLMELRLKEGKNDAKGYY